MSSAYAQQPVFQDRLYETFGDGMVNKFDEEVYHDIRSVDGTIKKTALNNLTKPKSH